MSLWECKIQQFSYLLSALLIKRHESGDERKGKNQIIILCVHNKG